MKKNLLGLFALVIAMFFVACDNSTGDLKSLKIKPDPAIMAEEDTMRLTVITEPAEFTFSSPLEWKSSDTSVVVVDNNGQIISKKTGDATITVKYGDITGVCQVQVKNELELLNFTGAIVWDYAIDDKKVYDIEAVDGTIYKCYLVTAELWICSEGFYINNSGYLDGGAVGHVMTVYAPMFHAPKELNGGDLGTNFCLGGWAVDKRDTVAVRVGAPAEIAEETLYSAMEQFCTYYNQQDYTSAVLMLDQAAKAYSGTTITTYTYDCEGEECGYAYDRVPTGVVNKAILYTNNTGASQYMMGIDYINAEAQWLLGGFGGAQLLEDEQGMISLKRELAISDPITYEYGEIPAEQSAKDLRPLTVPVLKKDAPEVAARIETALKNQQLKKLQ